MKRPALCIGIDERPGPRVDLAGCVPGRCRGDDDATVTIGEPPAGRPDLRAPRSLCSEAARHSARAG